MWRFLLLVFFIQASAEDKPLLGLSVNLDPVITLLGRDKPKVESTTVAKPTTPTRSIVTNRVDTNSGSCGRRQMSHTGLITSGQPTKPGDWPWHVAIYRLKTSSSEQKYICGGTLISRTRVISAGHCVVENGAVVAPERLYVVLGKFNFAGGDIGSIEKGVFQIVLHPDFSFTSLSNDIAVLKLSSIVTYTEYIQPACLWNRNKAEKSNIFNKHGTVIGWGFTEDNQLSTQLLKAEMPVKEDLQCIKTNPSFYSTFLSEYTFCAGFANGTSACNGDSGGGLFFATKDSSNIDIWSLRGIVSLSVSRLDTNKCDPNYYTIFTDSAQYLDFIEQHISQV